MFNNRSIKYVSLTKSQEEIVLFKDVKSKLRIGFNFSSKKGMNVGTELYVKYNSGKSRLY